MGQKAHEGREGREGYLSQRAAAVRFCIAPYRLRAHVREGRLQAYRDPANDRVMLLKIDDLRELVQPRPVAPEKMTAA